jgi:hypothetical protein
VGWQSCRFQKSRGSLCSGRSVETLAGPPPPDQPGKRPFISAQLGSFAGLIYSTLSCLWDSADVARRRLSLKAHDMINEQLGAGAELKDCPPAALRRSQSTPSDVESRTFGAIT